MIALALLGLAGLTMAAGCRSDLCLNGYVLSVLVAPLIGLFVGLDVRWLIGRSALLVAVDAVLAALIVSAAAPTNPRLDVTSIVLALLLTAIPLFAAVAAVREVT